MMKRCTIHRWYLGPFLLLALLLLIIGLPDSEGLVSPPTITTIATSSMQSSASYIAQSSRCQRFSSNSFVNSQYSTTLSAKDSRNLRDETNSNDSNTKDTLDQNIVEGLRLRASNIFFSSNPAEMNQTTTATSNGDKKDDDNDDRGFLRSLLWFRREKNGNEGTKQNSTSSASSNKLTEQTNKNLMKAQEEQKRKEIEAQLKKEEERIRKEQIARRKEEESIKKKKAEEESKMKKKKIELVALKEKVKKKVVVKLKDSTVEKAKDEDSSILRKVSSIFSSIGSSKEPEIEAEPEKDSSSTLSYIARLVTSRFTSSKSSNDEQWIPVFPKTRIDPGEVVPVTIAGIDLLVVASADGRRLYCIANSCPHLGTPLETGRIVRLPATNVKSPASVMMSESSPTSWTELEVSTILQQDGCEDCIVCPLHRTAFALQSGEVRGEWCPYPPFIGKVMGTVKKPTPVAVFDVRYRGKNVEVRLNSPLDLEPKKKQ
jgi:nitrite reductase/ring-hydroxylating ferredoxin subunit